MHTALDCPETKRKKGLRGDSLATPLGRTYRVRPMTSYVLLGPWFFGFHYYLDIILFYFYLDITQRIGSLRETLLTFTLIYHVFVGDDG